MARKRPETKMSKIARMLIEEYQPQSAEDIQEAIKDLLGDTLETMLKNELDEHLDYEYGDTPLSLNTRNGFSKKTVKSSSGEIELDIPRDRDGSFEPKVLKKYQKDISNIENQIISMYAKGMTTRDISSHIHEIYGFGLSEGMVSKITNKILPTIEKWQKKYPMCVSSWRNNWAELSTYFKYPQEMRTLIYTTNSMENFNRQLRKVTKSKAIFPNDFSLTKSLYLAMVDASQKWTYRIKNWDLIRSQLSIFFEGRI